jgi:NTE family protein
VNGAAWNHVPVTSVGLVLGAGGVVGHAYHAGTLATIAEVTGWDPRRAAVIVGTSAGSGVGATLRAGLAAPDFAARITGEPLSAEGAALLKGMERLQPPRMRPELAGRMPLPEAPMLLARDLMAPWRFRPGRALAALAPEGRVPTTGMGERMRRLHRTRWPEEPLWICALRLSDGERVVFGRDASPEPDVGTAVEASSAIPGYFAPVVIDGERYVDGGTHSPTNADLVAGIGLDLVVVVSPMSARTDALLFNIRAATRGFHRSTLRRELGTFGTGTTILCFEPTTVDTRIMGMNAMDPSRMVSVVGQAQRSARAHLAHVASAPAVELLKAAA